MSNKSKSEDFVLPCVVTQNPIYVSEKKDFFILRCVVDQKSPLYEKAREHIPKEWASGQVNNVFGIQFSSKGKVFVVRVSSNAIGAYHVGTSYAFHGKIGVHKQYGKQFMAEYAFIDVVSNADGLEIYLRELPNIGPMRARAIIDKFGVSCLNSIMADEDSAIALVEIKGLTKKMIPAIVEQWKKYFATFCR
jgi:hypothetical protein